tara:strand:+ start:295 stop:945 length:651 start_codon:yes stop_codon:yes gene_type:complete
MINIQIRGLKLKSCIGSLSNFEVNDMMNCIKLEKRPLADILLEKNKFGLWQNFDDVYSINSSLLTTNSELQITYFDENDYYHDGYTFFRINPDELLKKKIKLLLEFPKSDYFIINTGIFQGNCFETDLKGQSYKSFSKENLRLDSIDISWANKKCIHKIYFKDLELKDMKKNKNEMIQFTTMIIKPELDLPFQKIDNMKIFQRSNKIYKVDNNLLK